MIIRSDILNLKQFLHRQNVLKLYKTILKTVRQVPEPDSRQYLWEWARKDFKDQKHLSDPHTIKAQMNYAEALLNELQQSLALCK